MQKQPLRVFCEKGALKNFANFTEKHLRWVFFNGVADLKAWNFIKKRHQHRCCLRDLWNLEKRPFWRRSANDCFWKGCKIFIFYLHAFTNTWFHILTRLHNCTILIDLLSLTIYIIVRDKYNNNIYAGDFVYVFTSQIFSY